MTYGELKNFVLQLLNQYSVEGREVAETYNCQADDLNRIPALVRDGLTYITTTVRRLRATVKLGEPQAVGSLLLYELPADFYQLAGSPLQIDPGGRVERCRNYRILGGRQLLLTRQPGCTYVAEYFRYPAVPTGVPGDGEFLDCPPEAQNALAYYVAAHIAMEDNNFLYGALMNEFERKMALLREGVTAEPLQSVDVYSLG